MAYKQKKSMIAGTDPVKKAKEDKFLKEQKEEAVKSTDYLEKLPNPTTKAVKNKNYKIDEKEEQVVENMSNAKDNNFDGQTEMKINKLAKDHNVSANITEGSIESQALKRKENAKKKK